MARIWMEGFELGSGQHTLGNWDATYFSITTDVKSWGLGTYSFRGDGFQSGLGGGWEVYKDFSALGEIFVRFSWKYENHTNVGVRLFALKTSAGATSILEIYRSANSFALTAYKNGVSLGSLTTLDANWHTYEVRLKNVTGSYIAQIKIDGATYLDYSDATPVSGGSNIVRLSWGQASSTAQELGCYLDDIGVNDTTGATHNSWLGDGSVVALIPNANGDLSELTGSDGNSTDNYLLVDERPADDDTTYVVSDLVNKTDLYNVSFPTLPSGAYFTHVWTATRARKAGVSALGYKPLIKSLGTTTEEATAPPNTTTYTVHYSTPRELNPSTGVAWTNNDVDNLQIGVKVVAT